MHKIYFKENGEDKTGMFQGFGIKNGETHAIILTRDGAIRLSKLEDIKLDIAPEPMQKNPEPEQEDKGKTVDFKPNENEKDCSDNCNCRTNPN